METKTETTDMIDLAARFVNSTQRHIFLTGKAGTGKTTFLRDLAVRTHKRFMVVAPTGIAALNAKGVTIHSAFQLPFGSFIPDNQAAEGSEGQSQFYTGRGLSYKNHLSARKKQVLRSIDLLIIDEVSMLRADILDAIDYRLQRAKGRYDVPFGGVQLLMIGDLYQLPPIVKESEMRVLGRYYPSMHFFESRALKQGGMVYLELDKIFRQTDNSFVSILNNLRNGIATEHDLQVLNTRYKTEQEIRQMGEIIRLTTHNRKADRINAQELDALKGQLYTYEARIEDEFPEKQYPLSPQLRLKVGAQIMFIKNDRTGEGRYYNGKLATVVDLDDEEIEVQLADSDERIVIEQESWEHKRYQIDEKSKELEEELLGTFSQYPIKLAWAVTVHKSQGLTFDQAVIDVSDAFAPGQVYVAMSRLRSLDGLVLSQRISASVLSTDSQVVAYTSSQSDTSALDKELAQGQSEYVRELLDRSFDLQPIIRDIDKLRQGRSEKMEFEDEEMRSALELLSAAFEKEKLNTAKYRRQLQGLLQSEDMEQLLLRLEKGSAYYLEFLKERLKEVLTHQSHVEQFSRVKAYLTELADIDRAILYKRQQIERVTQVVRQILAGEMPEKEDLGKGDSHRLRLALLENVRAKAETQPKRSGTKTGRKRKKSKGEKKPKGETYRITYALLAEGKDIVAVAKERELAQSTVQGHVARGIEAGVLKLADFMKEEAVTEIVAQLQDRKDSKSVYDALGGKYSYAEIRMVQADRSAAEQSSEDKAQ